MREGSTDRETVEPLAPERIWAAPSPHGGWAEAHAGDWPSPANPHDTKFVRHDLYDAAVARAEAAEAKIRQAQEFCRSVVEEDDDDDPEALVGYARGAHFVCRKMLAVLSGQEEDTE